MRRIYYSSNFFRPTNISCFRYLRILSFSYYSVIKVQIHCLTSERCHRNFQEHRSLFNLFCFWAQNDPAHTAGSRMDLTDCGAYFTLCRRACQQIYTRSNNFLQNFYKLSVEMAGFEPATFALQRRCSPTELHPQDLPWVSGLDRIRTCDPCVISTVL